MTSPFQAAAAKMSGALDFAFRDEFQFVGMKAGTSVNLPRVADDSRQPFSAVAAFLNPSTAKFPPARASFADDDGHKVDVSVPRVSVDRARLVWDVRQGDRAIRISTGDEYEIAKVLPDGVCRVVLALTAKKR